MLEKLFVGERKKGTKLALEFEKKKQRKFPKSFLRVFKIVYSSKMRRISGTYDRGRNDKENTTTFDLLFLF